MVHGLVCRELLRHFTEQGSGRPSDWHTPGQPGRLLAASNQSLARGSPQQFTASIRIYGLRFPDNSSGTVAAVYESVKELESSVFPSWHHRKEFIM